MIETIQVKALELLHRLRAERGQTSAEYVAVTAVAVAIAIGVIFVTLGDALDTAVTNIGNAITDFVSDELP